MNIWDVKNRWLRAAYAWLMSPLLVAVIAITVVVEGGKEAALWWHENGTSWWRAATLRTMGNAR